MSYLAILILILNFQNVYSQISGSYKSNDPEYFPTFLCVEETGIRSFCIVEVMGKEHPDNLYFEKGTCNVIGDSIFFIINEVGFDSDSLFRENYVKKGLSKKKTIILLNEKGECYLKLKRKERFSRNSFCKECL